MRRGLTSWLALLLLVGSNASLSSAATGITEGEVSSLTSNAADPADAGVVRIGNGECVEWEASPAGTDQALCVDSSENLTYNGGLDVEGQVAFGNNAVPDSGTADHQGIFLSYNETRTDRNTIGFSLLPVWAPATSPGAAAMVGTDSWPIFQPSAAATIGSYSVHSATVGINGAGGLATVTNNIAGYNVNSPIQGIGAGPTVANYSIGGYATGINIEDWKGIGAVGGDFALHTKGGRHFLQGPVEFSAVISPTQITTDQNNYAPSGLGNANILRLTSDASRAITGFKCTSTGEVPANVDCSSAQANGRLLVVHNVGANPIVLKDESASSTAANRLALTADFTLVPDMAVPLQYDGTSSRWRLVGNGKGVLCDPTTMVCTIGADGQTTVATGALVSLLGTCIGDVSTEFCSSEDHTGRTFVSGAMTLSWPTANPTASDPKPFLTATTGGVASWAPAVNAVSGVVADACNPERTGHLACDGSTNDATALQAMIDSLTTGGGTVLISGVVALSTSVTPKSNVAIRCVGGLGGFKALSGVTLLSTSSTITDVTIAGCRFDLNGSTVTSGARAIGLTNTSNDRVTVERNVVLNTGTGSDSAHYLIELKCASGATCSIHRNRVTGSGTAFHGDTCIGAYESTTLLGAGMQITNNHVKSCGGACVEIEATSAGFSVNHNHMTSCRGQGACVGGSNAGVACSNNSECNSNVCATTRGTCNGSAGAGACTGAVNSSLFGPGCTCDSTSDCNGGACRMLQLQAGRGLLLSAASSTAVITGNVIQTSTSLADGGDAILCNECGGNVEITGGNYPAGQRSAIHWINAAALRFANNYAVNGVWVDARGKCVGGVDAGGACDLTTDCVSAGVCTYYLLGTCTGGAGACTGSPNSSTFGAGCTCDSASDCTSGTCGGIPANGPDHADIQSNILSCANSPQGACILIEDYGLAAVTGNVDVSAHTTGTNTAVKLVQLDDTVDGPYTIDNNTFAQNKSGGTLYTVWVTRPQGTGDISAVTITANLLGGRPGKTGPDFALQIDNTPSGSGWVVAGNNDGFATALESGWSPKFGQLSLPASMAAVKNDQTTASTSYISVTDLAGIPLRANRAYYFNCELTIDGDSSGSTTTNGFGAAVAIFASDGTTPVAPTTAAYICRIPSAQAQTAGTDSMVEDQSTAVNDGCFETATSDSTGGDDAAAIRGNIQMGSTAGFLYARVKSEGGTIAIRKGSNCIVQEVPL